MGYGRRIDQIGGVLSRALHVRRTEHDTVAQAEACYLGLDREALFPRPARVIVPRIERTLLDRARRTATLTWPSGYAPLEPSYVARHDGPYAKNLVAHARWLRPDGQRRRRALIYVHGWLEPGSWAEEVALFPRWSRELDVDIVHLALPFHGARTPEGSWFSGEWFWTADLVRSVEAVRQTVHDARSLAEWLRTEGGYADVGVTGLSLGGAICMLLSCLEPTPGFSLPLLAHIDLGVAVEGAPILARMKGDLESFGADAERRRRFFDGLGWARYEPRLAPERQLWVLAEEDLYIDPHVASEQRRRWGSPPVLWIPGGHMSFPLEIAAITRGMGRFLADLPPRAG